MGGQGVDDLNSFQRRLGKSPSRLAWRNGSVPKGNITGIVQLETPVSRIHIQLNSTRFLVFSVYEALLFFICSV